MLIAIVSDIHGNVTALDTVLADCPGVDRVWCLGDVVGYGPNPVECIDRIRSRAEICIIGNHDLAAIGRLPIREFNEFAAEAAEWTGDQLSAEDKEFLDGLPETAVHGEYTLTHGSPRDPTWEYINSIDQAGDNFEYFETTACFVGHSHVAIAFSVVAGAEPDWSSIRVDEAVPDDPIALGDRRHIINVGSVGQPRDRDPRAAYVILDTDSRTYCRRRVAYDIKETQTRMRRAGLPAPLWTRLTYGR